MISLQNVSRYYAAGERSVHALDDVSLTVGRHEFVAVVGPSGCGKSTLMHLIAGLDRPTAGEIVVDGLSLTTADDAELTNFRRRQLGLVFQFFNLLPTMNALENVSLPLLLQGVPLAESDARARQLLELVGLTTRATHFVHQLSGRRLPGRSCTDPRSSSPMSRQATSTRPRRNGCWSCFGRLRANDWQL